VLTPTIAVVVPTRESLGASVLAYGIAEYALAKRRRTALFTMDAGGALAHFYADRDGNGISADQSPRGVRSADFETIVGWAVRERSGYVVLDGSGDGRRDLYRWDDALDILATRAKGWPGRVVVFVVTNGNLRSGAMAATLRQRYADSPLTIVVAGVPLLKSDVEKWPRDTMPIEVIAPDTWAKCVVAELDFPVALRTAKFHSADRRRITTYRDNLAIELAKTPAGIPDQVELPSAIAEEFYLPPLLDEVPS